MSCSKHNVIIICWKNYGRSPPPLRSHAVPERQRRDRERSEHPMNITILAIGKNMPHWVTEGVTEYTQRLPKNYHTHWIEIPLEKRGKNADLTKIIAQEEDRIRAAIPKGSHLIALDRTGHSFDTRSLAKHLQTWHDNQQDITWVIGGPEGLSQAFLKTAHAVWSLSSLTLPHPLVRVVLAEQLYRAYSIIINHPYHR